MPATSAVHDVVGERRDAAVDQIWDLARLQMSRAKKGSQGRTVVILKITLTKEKICFVCEESACAKYIYSRARVMRTLRLYCPCATSPILSAACTIIQHLLQPWKRRCSLFSQYFQSGGGISIMLIMSHTSWKLLKLAVVNKS